MNKIIYQLMIIDKFDEVLMMGKVIKFFEREALPDRMQKDASEIGISVKQLVMRFTCVDMQDYERRDGPG